jgi:hypothetical protein
MSSAVERPTGGPEWLKRAGAPGMRIKVATRAGGAASASPSPRETAASASAASAGEDVERRYEEARARIFGEPADALATPSGGSGGSGGGGGGGAPAVVAQLPPAAAENLLMGGLGRAGFDDDYARGAHIWGPVAHPPAPTSHAAHLSSLLFPVVGGAPGDAGASVAPGGAVGSASAGVPLSAPSTGAATS